MKAAKAPIDSKPMPGLVIMISMNASMVFFFLSV